MTPILPNIVRFARLAAIPWLILAAGCASSLPTPINDHLAAETTTLNYTGKEIEYIAIHEPGKATNGAGGGALSPYGASGSMCCFSLPKAWRPGLQVLVEFKFWKEEGDSYPHTNHPSMRAAAFKVFSRLVDIPPYTIADVGTVWTIMHADETVEVLVSDLSPSHPQWPGRVKGNPVPSREYRLKLWQREVDLAVKSLERSKSVDHSDATGRKESWKLLTQYRRDEAKAFSGPDDPTFITFLEEQRTRNIQWAKDRLDYLMSIKP